MSAKQAMIPHLYNGIPIFARGDGYWNATAMCQANAKLWGDYWSSPQTQEFLAELSVVMRMPITQLVQVRQDGSSVLRATWVHRRVAAHLAQWCSAAFAVRVTGWIEQLLHTGRAEVGGAPTTSGLPWSQRIESRVADFRSLLRRHHPGRWSVVTELTTEILLVEDVLWNSGYPLSLSDLPDGSVGRLWSDYRQDKPWALDFVNAVPIDTGNVTPDGQQVWAYPRLYLPAETRHFHIWFRDIYAPERLPLYLDSKCRRDEPRWRQQGLTIPAPAVLAHAADGACRRLTGNSARLPSRLSRALPSPQRTLFD